MNITGPYKVILHCLYCKCSLDHAKRSFYRAANSIFGKIGRIASELEDVLMELLKTKCTPPPEIGFRGKFQAAPLS